MRKLVLLSLLLRRIIRRFLPFRNSRLLHSIIISSIISTIDALHFTPGVFGNTAARSLGTIAHRDLLVLHGCRFAIVTQALTGLLAVGTFRH